MDEFNKVEFLFLSQEDVIRVGLTMREVIAAVECVFREHRFEACGESAEPGFPPDPKCIFCTPCRPFYQDWMQRA